MENVGLLIRDISGGSAKCVVRQFVQNQFGKSPDSWDVRSIRASQKLDQVGAGRGLTEVPRRLSVSRYTAIFLSMDCVDRCSRDFHQIGSCFFSPPNVLDAIFYALPEQLEPLPWLHHEARAMASSTFSLNLRS